MRWHGFGKVNYKGLKQRTRVARLRIKAASWPRSSGKIVGRDRRARWSTERTKVQSFHAEPQQAVLRCDVNDSVRLAFGPWQGIGDQDVVQLR
jgi:hypothetical protein